MYCRIYEQCGSRLEPFAIINEYRLYYVGAVCFFVISDYCVVPVSVYQQQKSPSGVLVTTRAIKLRA